MLARQGLALRGEDENDSNFAQVLNLRTRDNNELKEWLKRKTSWISHDIQNEMLERMANSVLRKIVSKIRDHKFFALLCDETSDNTGVEQLSVSIRTVNEALEPEEHFLGFYALSHFDADHICSCIMDVLQRLNLSINNLRGQCYDGATVMAGRVNGVASRILEKEPRAMFTHCQMHSLNLAVQDCVSEIPVLRDFLVFVRDLIGFLRDSPKRRQIVRDVASDLTKQRHSSDVPSGCGEKVGNIRPLCPTRMTMRFHALDGLLNQAGILQEALESISNETNDKKILATVSGFLRRLSDFDFYFCLILCHSIFKKTDILSKQLQKTTVSTGEGISLCEFTKAQLRQMRFDEVFSQLWERTKVLAASVDADAPKLPKNRKMSRRLDQGSSGHSFDDPESYYRSVFFQGIDSVIGHIEKRIKEEGVKILSSIERIFKMAWSSASESPTHENEDFLRVVGHFGEDLDKNCLLSQLKSLSYIKEESSTSDGLSVPQILKVIGSTYLKKMIPEVCRLGTLYSVSPASTATCERSFSHLRRVKSYLRTSMGQKRLNHSCILTVYKEQVDSLNLTEIVNNFILANEQRRKTFAICK